MGLDRRDLQDRRVRRAHRGRPDLRGLPGKWGRLVHLALQGMSDRRGQSVPSERQGRKEYKAPSDLREPKEQLGRRGRSVFRVRPARLALQERLDRLELSEPRVFKALWDRPDRPVRPASERRDPPVHKGFKARWARQGQQGLRVVRLAHQDQRDRQAHQDLLAVQRVQQAQLALQERPDRPDSKVRRVNRVPWVQRVLPDLRVRPDWSVPKEWLEQLDRRGRLVFKARRAFKGQPDPRASPVQREQ